MRRFSPQASHFSLLSLPFLLQNAANRAFLQKTPVLSVNQEKERVSLLETALIDRSTPRTSHFDAVLPCLPGPPLQNQLRRPTVPFLALKSAKALPFASFSDPNTQNTENRPIFSSDRSLLPGSGSNRQNSAPWTLKSAFCRPNAPLDGRRPPVHLNHISAAER